MSDHGFGPFHKFIHVNNWLIKQGFMAVKPGLRARLKHTSFQLGFSPMNVYNTLMRLGFGKLKKEVVRGEGQGLLKTLFLSFEDIDWTRTKAYSLGNVGQIYLNVAGREPQGVVQPGDEYEPVRDSDYGATGQLRDPDTGEEVVEQRFTAVKRFIRAISLNWRRILCLFLRGWNILALVNMSLAATKLLSRCSVVFPVRTA